MTGRFLIPLDVPWAVSPSQEYCRIDSENLTNRQCLRIGFFVFSRTDENGDLLRQKLKPFFSVDTDISAQTNFWTEVSLNVSTFLLSRDDDLSDIQGFAEGTTMRRARKLHENISGFIDAWRASGTAPDCGVYVAMDEDQEGYVDPSQLEDAQLVFRLRNNTIIANGSLIDIKLFDHGRAAPWPAAASPATE